jgi:outer membrane receptor protein involved in Fe transport
MIRWKSLAIAAALVAAARAAAAQQPLPKAPGDTASRDTLRRDAVVLLPEIRAVAPANPGPPAASSVVMSGEAARSIPATDAWDLVRRGTGIEIHEQGQGPGFASDAVIRGFTSDHSSDVALVVDGVPMNEPINGHAEGYADWNQIFPELVRSITVLKGPMSAQYGNFALGGVLNVETVPAVLGPRLVVGGGSYGYGRLAGITGGIGDRFASLAAADLSHDDGWRQHSASTTAHALARGQWNLGEGRSVSVLLGGYGADWNSPGYLGLADFEAGRLTQAADLTDGGDTRRLHAHATYDVMRDRWSWHSMLFSYGGSWHLFLNVPPEGGVGEGRGSQTEELDRRVAVGGRSAVTWTGGALEVTGGAEARGDAATYDRWFTTARVRDSSDLLVAARHTAGALYGEVAWSPTPSWRLVVGGRMDALAYRTRHLEGSGGPWASHLDKVLSPKAGVLYRPAASLALFANFGRGFRAPDGVIGNPSLQPISEWASEVGARWRSNRLEASLVAFRLDVDGEQTFNPVMLTSTPQGRSRRQGLEADARAALAPGIALFGHGTWNDARYLSFVDQRGTDLSGRFVFQVAREVGEVGLDASVGGMKASLSASYTGPFTPIGEKDVRTPAYAVAMARLAIPVGGGTNLALGVENLFNQRVAEVRASGFVAPGTPRRLIATLHKEL